ncbi:glycoside hydrolase family 43 protein, partial [Klebsiella pneumoniae]
SFAINTFHRLLVGERHEAPIYFSGFNKHYFVFSDISGYRPSESKLYSFDIKNKKLNYISPFARGNQMDVKTTFQSQPAFVFKCINTGKLIYVADKWLYKDKLKYIWKSKYVWAEIKWDSNKIPYIDKTSFKKNNICE